MVSYSDGEFCFPVIADGCHGAYFQRISWSSRKCDGPYLEFSVGISMIIMFIVTMTELNQEMYQLISREGKIKERLEIATILDKCIAELISGEDFSE